MISTTISHHIPQILMPPSEEQLQIIQHVKLGHNVIVNAVAGSGKSTTILSIAKELSSKRILQITYNSRLRHEIKEKVDGLHFSNIDVHTFHSLAVKYYSVSAHTDTELRHILCLNSPPKTLISNIDILVIDEAQDMTFLYYQFVRKFILDSKIQHLQLLVLGDTHQCLYQFKGADERFLSFADRIWCFMDAFQQPEVKKRGRPTKLPLRKPRNFVHCSLQVSYRITDTMGHFVNRAMLGDNRMLTCREGVPVTYIRNSRFNIERTVVYEILQLLQQGDKPGDIFILGGSVRGANSHIRRIENILVENNIPCYIPLLEEDKDDRVVDGKIVFSTFHAVKGRQRKHVFIVGFDQSYFQYIARTANSHVCPNTLYVASTRATHRLYLLEFEQHATDRPLDFLKMNHFEMVQSPFVNFKGTPRIIFYKSTDSDAISKKILDKKFETPTGMIKFIPDSVMDFICPIIDRIFSHIYRPVSFDESVMDISEDACPCDKIGEIDIPGIISTEYGFEDVSELNGIALPAMYYDEIHKRWGKSDKKNVLYHMIESCLAEMRENEHLFLKNIVKELPTQCETIDDYLFLANVYASIQERLYFKLKQIQRTEYSWLSPAVVELCKSRLNHLLDSECKQVMPISELTIIHHSMEDLHFDIDMCLKSHFSGTVLENSCFRFSGIVDLITEKTLWEIKCTSKITIDHKLQLVIYAWLWQLTRREEPKQFKLLNIKNGEIWELHADLEDLTQIIAAILRGKYEKSMNKTDEEFMEEIHRINHDSIHENPNVSSDNPSS